jgi:hypothetical protein
MLLVRPLGGLIDCIVTDYILGWSKSSIPTSGSRCGSNSPVYVLTSKEDVGKARAVMEKEGRGAAKTLARLNPPFGLRARNSRPSAPPGSLHTSQGYRSSPPSNMAARSSGQKLRHAPLALACVPECDGPKLQRTDSRSFDGTAFQFALPRYGRFISTCCPSLQLILVEGSLVEIFVTGTIKPTGFCFALSRIVQHPQR